VTVRLVTITEEYHGMTRRDVELARRISAAARELGLSADPMAVHSLLVIAGATAPAAVMPFWRAVLGYEPRLDSPSEGSFSVAPLAAHDLHMLPWSTGPGTARAMPIEFFRASLAARLMPLPLPRVFRETFGGF
jgi:hypothetical protein